MKRVLITGGASGLGKALAERYGQLGYQVCITDINEEQGQAVAQDIASSHGVECLFIRLNVTDDEGWQQVAQTVAQKWQGLDLLVNNAGVASSGDIDQVTMTDFQWTMDVNVMGVVKGCHYIVPMLKKSQGHIVNVASMAGLLHMPSMSAYNASKAAVVALSETLLAELSPHQVGVSVLCPAFFKTNLTKTMRSTEQSGVHIANRLMEKSKVQVDDVVSCVVSGVEKNRFYLLSHPREAWLWRIKRWLPNVYFKIIRSAADKFHAKMTAKQA